MRWVALLLATCLVLSADNIAPGKYTGTWQGTSGGSGDIGLTLASADGKWTADVTFTLSGQDVKCTVKSLKVEGSKLEVSYTFDLQGLKLQSTVAGEMTGNKFTGKYHTVSVADGSAVDEGTFEAAAVR